ncbi:MAG: metallophosphoesterase [Candidatus Bathyarchaeia archaeon]|nr:metallophosphoesterase [Candidatus Bathyarchaeota archaeon]
MKAFPSPKEYLNLIDKVENLLLKERETGFFNGGKVDKGLVKIEAKGKLIVVGDLHGDLQSLNYIIKESKFLKSKYSMLIFLGDYIDRGVYSPEVLYRVLSLKLNFSSRVVVLRGNHEGPEDLQASPHDLPYQLVNKYKEDGMKIYFRIKKLFNILPYVGLVEGKYLFLHGGPPHTASSIKDYINACETHPKKSFLEEILWNDPIENFEGVLPSPRGAGKLFGENITNNTLKILNVKMIIRGHEPKNEGFSFNHNGKVLTLFSRLGAPYFNSSASYLEINQKNESFIIKKFTYR